VRQGARGAPLPGQPWSSQRPGPYGLASAPARTAGPPLQVGIEVRVERLGAGVGQAELEAAVRALGGAGAVDGLVVQLPLPAHVDAGAVLAAVRRDKDADGFHPGNLGRAARRGPAGAFLH